MSPSITGIPRRPLLALERTRVRAEPGQALRVDLTVRNPGNVVETYDLRVLGPTEPWVEIVPATISLFPGDEGTATLTLRPPMSSRVVAGHYVVGVQATSEVRPDESSTVELQVEVDPFLRFRAESSFTSVAMRRKGTLLVRVMNDGNSTVTYALSASDPEGYLRTRVKEPQLTLAPGEARWVEVIVIAAPRIIGSSFETKIVMITVTPLRDVDSGLPIVDPEQQTVNGSVLHKPFVRLRMGVFGRLVILLTMLGLIAAFLISRWLANQAAILTGTPVVPMSFSATTDSLNRVVLTWDPTPGADSYVLYGVGPVAGDPVPAPAPTVIVEPGSSPAGGVGAGVVIPALTPAVTPTRPPTEEEEASPVCLGCTEVATVKGGTTRYVVSDVNAGDACYRIAAQAGAQQSLFSKLACSEVSDAQLVDLDGNGTPDAVADIASLPPCAPKPFRAKPFASDSVVLLWGEGAPPNPQLRNRAMKAPGGVRMDGGAGTGTGTGADSGTGTGTGIDAAGAGCNPDATVTGYVLQRQVLTGWSDISPSPAAADTAFEVDGLPASNLACFRMKALAATGESEYSRVRCAVPGPATAPASGGPGASTAPDPAAVDAARGSTSGSGGADSTAPANPADVGPWGPIRAGLADSAPPAIPR